MLEDLTLSVPAGERVLLVGPSGCGKSTLLRAVAGLLASAGGGDLTGSVAVDGRAPGERPGSVGLVLQEPGAGVVAATVGRDVAFGLENTRVDPTVMRPRVEAALADVGLRAPLETSTRALSGGETQRLAIAGALALEPSVLLLDEPTAMLDEENAALVRDTVAEVSGRRGLTTVVVEHVLGPWVGMADRLVVLDEAGRVAVDGRPDEVLDAHVDELARLGIWVPGVPHPAPVRLPGGLVGPDPDRAAPAGTKAGPVLVADPLVVERDVTIGGVSRRRRTLATGAVACPPGTLTALVGPSGAGKSTALLALGGLLEPTRGRVRLRGGLEVGGLGSHDLAESLGWVPQWASSTIVAHTVLDEVLVTCRALGHDDTDARRRAEALLEALGLGHLGGADPRELSGGEQRRLALASAVLHRPAILLADEPTVGQDRRTWAAVVGLLEAVRGGGGAVVVATHDPAVVGRADDVERLRAPERGLLDPEPARPLATRCGPLSLLAAALLGVVASLVTPGWGASVLGVALAACLGAVALAAPGPGVRPRGRWRGLGLRLWPGLLGALSVGWSTWLLGGRDVGTALEAAARIVLLVLPAAVLLPYVGPDELGDHLAQRLRLPARPVVAVGAALQRLGAFAEQWTELARARRVRGLGPGRSLPAATRHAVALTSGLLVRTLGAAAELAAAMDARGFASARRRTWAEPAPWRLPDTLALGGGLAVVAVTLVARLG